MSSSLLSEPASERLSVSMQTTAGMSLPTCRRMSAMSALRSAASESGLAMKKNGGSSSSLSLACRNASRRLRKAARAFEADVDDGALPDAMAAIVPAERDVHQEVEDQEALAAFRRAPDDDEAASREEALDAIVVAIERREVGEADENEAGRRASVDFFCAAPVHCEALSWRRRQDRRPPPRGTNL